MVTNGTRPLVRLDTVRLVVDAVSKYPVPETESAVDDAYGKTFAVEAVEVMAPLVVSSWSLRRKLSGMRLRPMVVVATTLPSAFVARREFVRLVMANVVEVAGRTEHTFDLRGVRDDNRPETLELWVRPQPNGIRVSDAVEWAREILSHYETGVEVTPPPGPFKREP